MRVLVFQTAFLGDAILSIPLLKAIRQFYPQCELALVCRKNVGDIFVRTRVVDRVFEVDKKSRKSYKHVFLQTKEYAPDLVISAHRSVRTALWVWRLKAPESVGYSKWWCGWAYKHTVPRLDGFHDVIRQLNLIEGLGHKVGNLPDSCMSLRLDIEPDSEVEARFGGAVALAPGSQWETKRWSLDGYIKAGQALEKAGFKLVVVGTPQERSLCGNLVSQLHGAVNLAGETSVYELAQVLKACKLLICNDSGAMHVASLVETPVVSVFGPTVPAQGYSPWQPNATVVEVELPCRPCGAHGHRQCPLGHHDCMKKIGPQVVLGAAKPFLRELS